MSINLKNKNLLYVEYMELTKKENSKVFKSMFNKIFFSNNGIDALEIFKNNHIDYIITDICLPKMNGMDLTKEIRILNPDVPIIIHSLYASQKNFIDAIEYSVNSFVIKEKSANSLLQAIQKINLKNNTHKLFELRDNIIWNLTTKELTKNHEVCKLTKNESKLLDFLVSNNIMTSEVIQDFIYNDLTYNNKRINNLVSRLNLKLETKLVESVYGVGYKINSNQ